MWRVLAIASAVALALPLAAITAAMTADAHWERRHPDADASNPLG